MRTGGQAAVYFVTDHLGSTNKLVDPYGAPLAGERQLYKPWGEKRLSTSISLTRVGYTGQYDDSYINLYWIGSRWYDLALGRWIQPDPIVPLANQGTQAWDRYAYVNNSPVNFSDPTGHSMKDDSQGSGSEHLNETLKYFTDYGKHGDKFNEFYSTVHFAEVAYADAVIDGVIDEGEATVLEAYEKAIDQTYNLANAFVRQKDYSYDNVSSSANSIIIRAATQGFNTCYEVLIVGAVVVVVRFGHGARHLEGSGLSSKQVEAAIADQVQAAVNSSSGPPGAFWGRVTVEGAPIEYRAWILPDGSINVGTYYFPKK